MAGQEFKPYQFSFEEQNGSFHLFLPPERFHVTTGGEEIQIIFTRIGAYFDNVLSFIGYNEQAREVFTERKRLELKPQGLELGRETEFAELLFARDHMIATGIVTHDPFNYRQIACNHFLTPDLIKELQRGI